MKKSKITLITICTLVILTFAGIAVATPTLNIYVNGKKLTPSTPAQIINGHTMVPLRFVAEALDADVKWNPVNNSVLITTTPPETPEKCWSLIKLNGEPTTWPYWYENGHLYLEQRNALELLRTKYKSAWYSISFSTSLDKIYINGKSSSVITKEEGNFKLISINSMQNQSLLKFTWDEENENLIIEDN